MRSEPVSVHHVETGALHIAPAKINKITAVDVASLNYHAPDASELVFRLRDLILGGLFALLLAPLLVVIAVLIKAGSPGPVIFRQRRGGRDGRSFVCYKFRTMTVLEDGDHVTAATQNDHRVTRIGRILRRYSLDELPQLFNVLKGDMALVGPRPHALAHDRRYSKLMPIYYRRQSVKPGMTGLAQVLDLRGEVDCETKIIGRIAADISYIERRSIFLDFVILAMTPLMLIFCRSAC